MFPTHSAVLVIASLAETAAAIADHAGLPTSPGSPVRSGWNGRAVPGRSSRGATRLGSPGRWLQVIGVAHAGVGVVLHRDPLAEIVRARWSDRVPIVAIAPPRSGSSPSPRCPGWRAASCARPKLPVTSLHSARPASS